MSVPQDAPVAVAKSDGYYGTTGRSQLDWAVTCGVTGGGTSIETACCEFGSRAYVWAANEFSSATCGNIAGSP